MVLELLPGGTEPNKREKITNRIDIKFSARFGDERIEFAGRAIVVRIDKERQEMAALFAMLDEDARVAIAKHFGDGIK